MINIPFATIELEFNYWKFQEKHFKANFQKTFIHKTLYSSSKNFSLCTMPAPARLGNFLKRNQVRGLGANSINFNRTPVVLGIRHWALGIEHWCPAIRGLPNRYADRRCRMCRYGLTPRADKSRNWHTRFTHTPVMTAGQGGASEMDEPNASTCVLVLLLRHCFSSGWVCASARQDLCHFVGPTKRPGSLVFGNGK